MKTNENDFDMPPESAKFEARGGWLIRRFMNESSLGFTNVIHPAAVVGNLGGESGLKAVNERVPMVKGSRGGWGWAQWTGPRRRQFEKYCDENNLSYSSDKAQYDFLVWELLNTEKRALNQTKKTTTLEAAVETFCILFERPSDPQGGLPSRNKFAQLALVGYEKLESGTETEPEPEPTEPLEDYGQEIITAMIRVLQLELKSYNYYEGEIDGIWGPKCQQAMEDFNSCTKEEKE